MPVSYIFRGCKTLLSIIVSCPISTELLVAFLPLTLCASVCTAAWINKLVSVTATDGQFYVSVTLMIFDKQLNGRLIEV